VVLGFASSALVSGSSLGWCVPLTLLAKAVAAPAAARSEHPVAVGQPAPPLALPDLAGQIVTLNAYQGRPLIVNFWATWCEPCREEMPLLQQVHNAHQRAGLIVLGISQDSEERLTAVRTYWTQSGWSFPSLLDPDGAVARRYQVFLLPSTIFINAQGVVAAMHHGPINATQIEQYLAKIL
jgi:cytochrome c biogenesis protein CcmG/thiol:disulfide interchange protein DsbE